MADRHHFSAVVDLADAQSAITRAAVGMFS